MRWRVSYENMIVIAQELARHESAPQPHVSPVITKCFAAACFAWRARSPILRIKRMIFRSIMRSARRDQACQGCSDGVLARSLCGETPSCFTAIVRAISESSTTCTEADRATADEEPLCRRWVIFDRLSGDCRPVDVRFSPKAAPVENWPPTTSHSSDLHLSGYGCAPMSPRPRSRRACSSGRFLSPASAVR
jgi:hypothetical protein